ncbi:hypothetical protein D9Q98_004104 [Chlorella vulgaris]|uniref:Uncharacterized protein n=1 Tax=Chlorella vulgaris TaxID=3077 RepID=A0A9D4TRN4_CHLVU|nr:hypothetical protein D9Q98_004104 [Chlorella vulgaris]
MSNEAMTQDLDIQTIEPDYAAAIAAAKTAWDRELDIRLAEYAKKVDHDALAVEIVSLAARIHQINEDFTL